ncbi:MAG: sugar ABC transporter ATP-binding protein [Oscillospiraceae bacterium]|nr:sugar ABC transporter ATP-binding protein [Oscillospiraceae bacterium]
MSEKEILFEARGIYKSFGPTRANQDVNITLRAGEIHALAGENGSGKSTLISILCGMQKPDAGEMFVKGQPYAPKSPLDAYANNIGFVVQELGIINDLPVAYNIYLGNLDRYKQGPVLNTTSIFRDAKAELEKHGFDVPVREMAGNLPVEKRKLTEITKAMTVDPDILILDETTQALSYDTRQKLYQIINEEKEKGTAILFVTHDVEEMCELADVVTVLRDGRLAADLSGDDVNVDNVRQKMVGRKVEGNYYRDNMEASALPEVAIEVRDLSHGKAFRGVTFDVHYGEIVGICGLSDAGIHELGKTICGILKASTGTVYLPRTNAFIKNPKAAVNNGMAYVPKDRDSEALMMKTTIHYNELVPSLTELSNAAGMIMPKDASNLSDTAAIDFNVRCLGTNQAIGALSGGNKQKVSISRWLVKQNLDILVMDCPTRGVDVGVKAYIYSLIKQLKEKGVALILVADEMGEAIGMADRIVVLKDGKLNGILNRHPGLDEHEVIEVMI